MVRIENRLRRSFFTLTESRIAHFRAVGQESTADNYRCALCCFREFRRQRDLSLAELTSDVMKLFQQHLQQKGLSMNTISLYIRCLRASYNYALDEELLREDRHPFRKVFTGVEKTRKRAVREEVVRQLMALDLSDAPPLDVARDMFLFSIYAQGMAFVDMAHLTADNLSDGRLTYKRRKTGRSWIACSQGRDSYVFLLVRGGQLQNFRCKSNKISILCNRIHSEKMLKRICGRTNLLSIFHFHLLLSSDYEAKRESYQFSFLLLSTSY